MVILPGFLASAREEGVERPRTGAIDNEREGDAER
jgi:hypothetical protein